MAPLTATFHNADATLSEYGVRWAIIPKFYYEDIEEEEVGRYEYLRHAILHKYNEFDDKHFLKSDVKHVIECRDTGVTFSICHHTVADAIEWSAVDNSWSYVFMVRTNEFLETSVEAHKFEPEDASLNFAVHLNFSGDEKEFAKYPMLLKLTVSDPEDFEGFELIAPTYEAGVPQVDWKALAISNAAMFNKLFA